MTISPANDPPLVGMRLARELTELDQSQRRAVTTVGHLVARAGPGSGKTRTLVARAAYLLETDVSPFRGVACLTFTNAAADEIRLRVRRLGVPTGRRLVCSTVHGFCLNDVLRRFAPLTGVRLPDAGSILDEGQKASLLQHVFDRVGIADNARYRLATLTKIRRALACQEDLGEFDRREVMAARRYESELESQGLADFEWMTARSLDIVQRHRSVQDLLRARFPHVIVDEYQDLGGVLHQLVLTLRERAGIVITAVGDVDQSIYGFTGADPRYLDELSALPDVRTVDLEVNYRSGATIISASDDALGRTGRNRRSALGRASGTVEVNDINGGLDVHALTSVTIARDRISTGVPPERIAVLYPRRGFLLDALRSAFETSGLAYLHERDTQLPEGELSQFAQQCAARAIALISQRRLAPDTPSLETLGADLRRLRRESSIAEPSELVATREILRAVDQRPAALEEIAGSWMSSLANNLDLHAVAAAHPDRRNSDALDEIGRVSSARNLRLADLAAGANMSGKVLLTTYHSAKGREFDTVILPGLVDGLVPATVNVNGAWVPSSGAHLAEQRRMFFVAVSRAESELHCIAGTGYSTGYRWISSRPSPFLELMRRRIRDSQLGRSTSE